MVKLTNKQLEEQIRLLKNVKPRKEWALSLKSQILSGEPANITPTIKAQKASFANIFSVQFIPKTIAYSLAGLLFLVVGISGLMQFAISGNLPVSVNEIAGKSEASLTNQTTLKQDVVSLKSNIDTLAQVTKTGAADNIPAAVAEVNQNASKVAKNLQENSANDPETIDELAMSLKTLADVPGTNLTANPGVASLYKTVVENQITELNGVTLTDSQVTQLSQAEDLYNQGKYADALELILLIGKQ